MVPVEAQACGCPVVALAEGGAAKPSSTARPACSSRDRSAEAFADGLSRVALAGFRRISASRARRALLAGAVPDRFQAAVDAALAAAQALAARRSTSPQSSPEGRSDDAAVQPPARGLLRRHGRAARDGGVRHRLPAAIRDLVRRLHPGHQGTAAVRAVPQRAAAARHAGAARLPRAGPLSAAPRAHARGRLLRGLRRQHPGRCPRPHRHARTTRSTTRRSFHRRRRHRESTRFRGRSGCSSSSSTSS